MLCINTASSLPSRPIGDSHDSTHPVQRRPRSLSRQLSPLHGQGNRAVSRSLGRAGLCGPRGVAQGGCQRLFVHDHARGPWWRRRGQAVFGGADGGAGARRFHRHRLRAAQRDRGALHPALRHRGAEGQIPAAAGQRRDGGRHRHERAGRRQRSARRQDHRPAAARWQLPAQRQQDLHHQRLACRPGDRGRQDQPGGGRQGHQPVPAGERHAGLPEGQAPEEAGPESARHQRAVFRQRQAAARATAGRPRAGKPRLHLPDGAAALGAAADRHRRGVGRAGCDRLDGAIT